MTDDLKDLLAEDEVVLPDENKLGRLTALARQQLAIEAEIEDMQMRLKGRQDALKAVSEQEIPQLMHEIGAREIKLLDGRSLKIAPFYSGKITSPECYDYLDEHGSGEIVKTQITVSMPMSDKVEAARVREVLQGNGFDWDETNGVHHSTLKAWIKDTIQSGKPIDRDLFAVFTGWKTIIK